MLSVEKSGGTSMSARYEVIENIMFYGKSGDELYNRVFVVSAFAGVADLLLENKKTGAPGIYQKITKHQDFRGPVLRHIFQILSLHGGYCIACNIPQFMY